MDKHIECIDCNQDFEFPEGEQQFFASHDLEDPKRCKPCRAKKREQRGSRNDGGGFTRPPRKY